MNSIRLNNKKLDMDFDSAQFDSLGEMIDFLYEDKISGDSVITEIALDGEVITSDNRHDFYSRTPDQFEVLEIEVEDQLEVAHEAIDTAIEHAEAMLPIIEFAAKDYGSEKTERGDQHFFMAMDALDLFVRLVAQLSNSLRVDPELKLVEDQSLADLESHMAATMSAILTSKESNDFVALSELLEQDLMENLKKWKDQALPNLKRVKSN